MTYLERLAFALYLSEGWYVCWSERKMYPDGLRNYGRTRAVVLFDRVLNIEYLDPAYPKDIVNGACICGPWPGDECLRGVQECDKK